MTASICIRPFDMPDSRIQSAEARPVAALPAASSMTHVHLLACVNTELTTATSTPGRVLRILDAGCGNGRLIAYLHACLSRLHPECTIELYGFDVVDHGVQQTGFIQRTVDDLRLQHSEVDWSDRIRAIGSDEAWPFADATIDLVVSNQVLEHVKDHGTFFSELHRVLVRGGKAIHLFPLKHYIYEGHLHLPWVHRIRSHDLRIAYIALLSRLGLGKYPAHRNDQQVTVETFSERHADYMAFWTNYVTESEAHAFAQRAGLRTAFRYTAEFYAQKVRSMVRLPQTLRYRARHRGLWDSASVKILRYVSSVTLTCEKENCY